MGMYASNIVKLKSEDRYVITSTGELICLAVTDSTYKCNSGMNLTKPELKILIETLEEFYKRAT
jgi:hypothetical protein